MEYPVLHAPIVPSDVTDIKDNALDWVRKSCSNLTLRLTEMPEWI
jgi:DNA polymerase epsilon subunit 1